jgi:hypothetical protein
VTDFDGRAMDLFVEVVGMSPDQREARLDAACGCVPELRARVEALLAHHQEAQTIDFLRPPPPPPDFRADDEAPPDLPRRYKLLTRLDAGAWAWCGASSISDSGGGWHSR